jgi:hypothetical protein
VLERGNGVTVLVEGAGHPLAKGQSPWWNHISGECSQNGDNLPDEVGVMCTVVNEVCGGDIPFVDSVPFLLIT